MWLPERAECGHLPGAGQSHEEQFIERLRFNNRLHAAATRQCVGTWRMNAPLSQAVYPAW